MLRSVFRNPLVEWLVMVGAIIAGILVFKFLAEYLPSGGLVGGIRQAILTV